MLLRQSFLSHNRLLNLLLTRNLFNRDLGLWLDCLCLLYRFSLLSSNTGGLNWWLWSWSTFRCNFGFHCLDNWFLLNLLRLRYWLHWGWWFGLDRRLCSFLDGRLWPWSGFNLFFWLRDCFNLTFNFLYGSDLFFLSFDIALFSHNFSSTLWLGSSFSRTLWFGSSVSSTLWFGNWSANYS